MIRTKQQSTPAPVDPVRRNFDLYRSEIYKEDPYARLTKDGKGGLMVSGHLSEELRNKIMNK